MSCLPTLYKSVMDVSYVPKSEEEKIAAIVKNVESTSGTSSTANIVAVINFNQPVVKYDYAGWLGTQTFMRIMDSFAADESIAAVVINFDCGGGQVYGTGQFYDYLVAYPKPYVAFTHGYMCSGAFYLAAPAKHIVVSRRADAIGSIGAYATIIDTDGIWAHFGAKVHTLYATKSTEKNAEYREVIENGNYEPYIKNSLDPTVETFHADMKAVRPMLKEEVFAGGTWKGDEAVEMGLADSNGSLQDAINIAFDLASKSKSQTTNTMSNSKQLPRLQAVLGLDAPLASTEENGTYLNSEQLDSVEADIERLETAASTATQALADATEAHTAALATANGTVTAAETSVNAMLTASNLPVEGTLNEKLTALSAHVTEMNGKDGASHTTVRTEANAQSKEIAPYVDANASHNQIANSLK